MDIMKILLIRFGTDYLWRYIGLIYLVDGEAAKCRRVELYLQMHQLVFNKL